MHKVLTCFCFGYFLLFVLCSSLVLVHEYVYCLSVCLYKKYVYRHFVFSLSFSSNLFRVCTAISFSIKDTYRLFVFSLSFPLGMCRVCTVVSFSIKDIYVQTFCFLSVLLFRYIYICRVCTGVSFSVKDMYRHFVFLSVFLFRYVQNVHWSFLFYERYICTDTMFSLCPSF